MKLDDGVGEPDCGLGKVEELYQKWCKKGKPSGKPLGEKHGRTT